MSAVAPSARHVPEIGAAPDASIPSAPDGLHWRILVADRDPEVHAAVRGALQGRRIAGRSLASLHAHSLAEAFALMPGLQAAAPEWVMLLLDAALDAPEGDTAVDAAFSCPVPAALELVRLVHGTAGLESVRVVLRTSRPGQSVDAETMLLHGIHDDRSKAELTSERLLALVAGAVQAGSARRAAGAAGQGRGFEDLVRSSACLLEAAGPQAFAEGAIAQLGMLLGNADGGVACMLSATPEQAVDALAVLAATGRYAGLSRPLGGVAGHLLRQALERGKHVHGEGGASAFHIGRPGEPGMAIFMELPPLAGADAALLDAFCAHWSTLLYKHGQLTRLHEQAYYDPLVRLPNRVRFVEKVDECARLGMREHVLALLDIDDFSATNDVMGHRFGDRLLQQVAERLTQALPAGVLLARLGADTFGVLGSAQLVSPQRLLDGVRQPILVDGLSHKVSLTCGYVRLPEAPQAGIDLVKDATIALKRAKRDHRGQHLEYSEHIGAEARARALLVSDLRSAIDHEQLFLVYQPQLDLVSRELVGLEALLRWRMDDGRLMPPDQFIPVAEHSGLIVALGQWVLFTACSAMRALLDAGHAPHRMAVNVSAVQLQDAGFFDMVRAALARNGLQGSHLELEITESVAALPTQLLEATLSRLRAEGVSIAIDDFGTGYSSLSYLERLPLDRIKIDRSFVRHLGEPHGARIAEMVAQLGRKLGLKVLAEGIEDVAAWQALLEMGCHEGQGYFIARPMEASQLMGWLRLR